eukprot:CAMPEP_0116133100 /NCGR_PEP_ID=MMETSP0329-20121206/9921_1 /TAXON_ID=697910 /ORGANISM="Pseudo-nitzschia arenysensis, Strain B593" /LENGTH=347 /DNA_ID=CAMNT_0003627699 /DNA_START=275 /DNA_END=1318 /DNA_ORIENTATION=-
MKLALATLSLVFAAANAASLRVQKAVADSLNETNEAINKKHLNSKIVLQGTTGEPTTEDMEFIGKALVSSYNDVHWEVGHFMTAVDTVVSSESGAAFDVQTPVLMWIWPDFRCRMCPDDDAMGATQQSLLLTAISEDCAGLCNNEATAELEVNFCDRIKSSQGSKYLSTTTACSISFDADVKIEAKVDSKESPKDDGNSEPIAALDTTIVLKGVASGETTQEEKAILAKAFVAAYNDVHWKDNHYLNDAEIPFIASRANAANDDSNTLVFDVQTPVLMWIWPDFRCRMCPDDDAMGLAQFDVQTIRSNDFDKEAIEVAFCRKLQGNMVSEKLAAATSCSLAVETILA